LSKPCTGCGGETTDVLTIPRLRIRLPYHPACALEAERDLRAILAGITEALAARVADRRPCDGPLFRADEI